MIYLYDFASHKTDMNLYFHLEDGWMKHLGKLHNIIVFFYYQIKYTVSSIILFPDCYVLVFYNVNTIYSTFILAGEVMCIFMGSFTRAHLFNYFNKHLFCTAFNSSHSETNVKSAAYTYCMSCCDSVIEMSLSWFIRCCATVKNVSLCCLAARALFYRRVNEFVFSQLPLETEVQ